jgi:hypothetical protein
MKILPRKHFKPREDDTPEVVNPTVKLEIIEGADIGISVNWPPGTDLTALSQMLIWLHNGDLVKGIMREMQDYAATIGEVDKAIGAQINILQGIGKTKKANSVIVPPRKAIKHNMRLHHA